ncbi:uncharacterized protein [Macrobrachium rosenbergii]|uniref:uncharacterized protein n=1 Tax=Macrobrachium rosenbergii TaxID=79674 RepID=UPI0034D7613E
MGPPQVNRISVTFVTLLALCIASTIASPSNGKNVVNIEKPYWQPRFLGQVQLKHAAFMEMYYTPDESLDFMDRWNLYISSFDPLGGLDEVYRMKAPGKHLDNITAWNIEVMDKSAYWPNNPDYLPSSVGGSEGVIWTSGFLVPGKQLGKLQMYDTTKDPVDGPYNIASLDSKEFSYHRVRWRDMDLDGDLDAVTARFHIPLLGWQTHQLVWFENEGRGFSEGWVEHVVTNGPDVHFDFVTLTAGGRTYECIVAGEFLNERISIVWTESETGDWSDPSQVGYRVINENAGQVFDVLVGDFNEDGVQEFIATEYKKDTGLGQVTVYQFPEDFRTGDFPNFTIADGFKPHQSLVGQTMSPGTPKAFYPTAAYAEELAEDGRHHKPYILLSGDDDGKMYILDPATEDRGNWTYTKNILTDTEKMTVGKMAHGDVDGDGYEEVIVAGYTVGELYVYTYAP